MPLTKDNIREITFMFCRVARKFVPNPDAVKDVAVVLDKEDDGWTLRAIRKPIPHRKYSVIIDLPEDLFDHENQTDFLIDLASIISAKLTNSARTLNSNEKRSPELRLKISQNGNAARRAG